MQRKETTPTGRDGTPNPPPHRSARPAEAGTDEMQATKRRRRTEGSHGAAPDPRVVRIEYRPVPDTEARLRRLAAILLKHATHVDPRPGDGENTEGR